MNKSIIRLPAHSRCLVVEDNYSRLEWFIRKIPDAVTAVSPLEAIAVLDTSNPFDIIFLDHDCDGKFFADPTDPEFLNKSFWRVAMWLRRTKYDGIVIIHSGNPVGAARMAAEIGKTARVHVMPFGTSDIEVIP